MTVTTLRSVVITSLVLGSLGCGTYVSSTPINGGAGTRSPRAARSVAIYASGPPERPYRDVALMRVEQFHGVTAGGMSQMLDRLRDQAGAMGCDGVVLGGVSERDGAGWNAAGLIDPGSTSMIATCIVFRDQRRPSLAAGTTGAEEAPSAPAQRWDGEEPR